MINKLNKDDIDFILNLSHEMKTQDNRITAQPYALVCTTKQRDIIPEGYGDKTMCVYDDETFDTPAELLTYFDIEKSNEDLNFDDAIDLITEDHSYTSDKFDFVDYHDYQDITKSTANFFLTKSAYNEHIRVNGHNLNEPQSYGIHLYRNKELSRLYEVIHNLADILKEK
jgi:hypothetical protein